eukprot:5162575-Alexandrium_andersonii.AAC.1
MVERMERWRSRSRRVCCAGIQEFRSFALYSCPQEVAREELWLLLAAGARPRDLEEWRLERALSRAVMRDWLAHADLR